MNLVADEGVEAEIVAALREDDLFVVYVAELAAGMADPEVLKLALEGDAVLLTADKDFGELVFRQGLATHGVVLLNGVPGAPFRIARVCPAELIPEVAVGNAFR